MWVKADLDPWAGHCCSLPVRSVFLFGEERKVWVYVRGWIHLLLWTLSAVDSSWERKEKKSLSRQNYIWSGLIWQKTKNKKKTIPWVRSDPSVMGEKQQLLPTRSNTYRTVRHIYNIFTIGYSSQTSRNFKYKTRSDTQNMSETFFRSMETFTTLQCLHSAMLRNGRPIKKQANILHWIPALPIYMENKGLRLDPTLHQSKYLQWPPICPLNWSGPGASVPLPINGGLFLESRGFVWPPGCGECSRRSLKPATSPSCNDKQKMHFLFCGIHWLAGGFSLHQLCMAR